MRWGLVPLVCVVALLGTAGASLAFVEAVEEVATFGQNAGDTTLQFASSVVAQGQEKAQLAGYVADGAAATAASAASDPPSGVHAAFGVARDAVATSQPAAGLAASALDAHTEPYVNATATLGLVAIGAGAGDAVLGLADAKAGDAAQGAWGTAAPGLTLVRGLVSA